jgi:hypothetical protein
MFGMLDYRAHKLFWLLTFPLRLSARLGYFACIVAGILVAPWSGYSLLLQIIIGYAAFETCLIIVGLSVSLLLWLFRQLFFWLVDVVPSQGVDLQEAKMIVQRGPAVAILRRYAHEIESFTDVDELALVAATPWRVKAFRKFPELMRNRVRILKRFQLETGRQPISLVPSEASQLFGNAAVGWLERAVSQRWICNAVTGLVLIAVGVLYFSDRFQ